MPEHLKSLQTPSHAQTLRQEAGRRLSRSPHPYHRQHFELPFGSERFSSTPTPGQSSLRSEQTTDDEDLDNIAPSSARYRDSDSGTEADDEHFLKGLPAPKIRPHKGLKGGVDTSLSGSPSPLMSPGLFDEDPRRTKGLLRMTSAAIASLDEEDARRYALKTQHKRRTEIVRRITEACILLLIGAVLCLDIKIRTLLWSWRRELFCQVVVITLLILLYPFRLLYHLTPASPLGRPLPLEFPSTFDPAPLFYPPAITMLVSALICIEKPSGLLPSIILSIASLPRELIPAYGGLEGSKYAQWLLSIFPLLIFVANKDGTRHISSTNLDPEVLILLPPLHQSVCTTLQYLTTTSLLPAELQLLSIALIDLLLLASSPQAVILKALLWGGGVGVLVSCGHVLRWGVALARVPKWRFKRASVLKSGRAGLKNVGIFTRGGTNDSSDDNEQPSAIAAKAHTLDTTSSAMTSVTEYGPMSAIEPSSNSPEQSSTLFGNSMGSLSPVKRRHTMPTISSRPLRSSKETPSGRRKRASSSSVQSFISLTQSQASMRKWIYAAYVYICVLAIILVGIREYVSRFALNGNEPLGWALGYLFGDISYFRMEVVISNLQRRICLPPRHGEESEKSCHLGWVEHTRHAFIGEANTRLCLCAYWLLVICVGLVIVFRLTPIYEVDTLRKVFHFMMVAMLLPATYIDPTFAALALSLILAIFLLLDLFRISQLPPLSKALAQFLGPYVDGRDLKGPVVISHIFLLIGCAIPLWLTLGTLPRTGRDYLSGWEVPLREVSMVSGVICVGMGDAAASLIGRRYGRRKWIWGGGKSIEGSVAFAVAVAAALVAAKLWLRLGQWPANNDDSWFMTVGKSGVAAGVASLTEAVLTGGNDNVVCPIVLWLCVKGLDL